MRNLNDQLNLNIKYVELYEPPLIPSPNWNTDKEEKSDVEKIDYNQNTLVENQEEESGDSGTCTDIEFIEKDKSTYDNVLEKVIRDSEKMIIEKKHTQKKNENQRKLKRNSIPQPNRKMKSFHWIKVNEETIGKFIFTSMFFSYSNNRFLVLKLVFIYSIYCKFHSTSIIDKVL